MGALLAWLILIVGFVTLAFYQSSVKVWLPVSAVLLFILSFTLATFFIYLFWIIWAVAAVFLLVSELRIHLIMRPFLKWFSQQLPPLNSDEKEMIESGGVWWERQFFTAHPEWNKLFSISRPQLSAEEQDFLDNQVEILCQMLNDWQIVNEDQDLPKSVWAYIKKEKFWGLIIPKKYGGREFSALGHSAVISKVASRSMACAVSLMVPNSLGPAEFLLHYGTEEQREHYLPLLASGQQTACFALTSPIAGSDATSITDYGIVCRDKYQGQEILGIRLSFDKRYITLAPIATLVGLAFKLYDPDHLLGDEENIGITFAIVPAETPGVAIGTRHYPLNNGFLNGPIRGENVFIPIDAIIGGVENRGQGWHMMVQSLAVGRSISLPALASGGSKIGLRMTSAYMQLRRQFNRAIGDFEGVALPFAKMAALTYLMNAARIFTAQAVDEGARPAVASAIVKYHLTEFGRMLCLNMMDILGGRAIQTGPRNFIAETYKAMPISITVEGANILTRNLIIYGQGVFRCHPYLTDELVAASQPESIEHVKKFDNLILSHVNFVVSCLARSFVYGLTGGRWVGKFSKGKLTYYTKQLTRMSNAFALTTDIALLVLGGKLKFKESLSARLGDILSYCYLASAVMKYYVDSGEEESEWPVVSWCLDFCLAQIQIALHNLLYNFPQRWLGKLLLVVIFPWGRAYHFPEDKMSMAIAKSLQKDLVLRDRLTQNCFVNENVDDATGRVEAAFQMLQKVMPLIKKLDECAQQHADVGRNLPLVKRADAALKLGLLTADEHSQLHKFDQMCLDVLQVDEFTFNERRRDETVSHKQEPQQSIS